MKNKEKLTATISASTELFDFLKEKVGERKTRTEAYCDLLDKSQAGFISPFLRKQDFELGPSQCHVTVSDLASEWHWHRATVRSFLETLESFGQLERTKLPKSMVITMRLHDGNYVIPDIAQGETGFVQQLNGVMSGWVNGNIASYDAGIACGKIVHKAITDAGLKDELPEDDCIVTLRKLSERMDKRHAEGAAPGKTGRKNGTHGIPVLRPGGKMAVIYKPVRETGGAHHQSFQRQGYRLRR